MTMRDCVCGVCPGCRAGTICSELRAHMERAQSCTCWTHAGCKSCEAVLERDEQAKRFMTSRDLVDTAFKAAIEEDGFTTVWPPVKS